MKINPAGAHVTSSKTTPTGDLFFVSSVTNYPPVAPIRGGVPLVGPWFAEMGGKTPKHGLLRMAEWQVSLEPHATGLDRATAHAAAGGFEWALAVSELEEGIKMVLTATNITEEPLPLQMAFHPYFLVEDIKHVQISGYTDVDYRNNVTGETGHTKGPSFGFTTEVDRIYPLPADGAVEINDRWRTINVTAEGADHFVVWNPGSQNDLMDLGRDEWRNFVCVEPALLGENLEGITLAPGAFHQLTMTVTVNER